MKAEIRSREVNVSKSSAAVVRNSSVDVTVVVLTKGPPLLAPPEVEVVVEDEGFAFACAAVEDLMTV